MTLPDKGSRPLLSLSVSERDRRIAAEVETAFVSGETGAGGEGIPEASVDSQLLQTVPAPPPLNFEKLEQEVSRQRRLVVRGAVGIPIAGVLAVGGSLLLHAILAGAFVASFWILLHAPRGGGGGGGELLTGDGDGGGGGSHGGTLFISDVPAMAAGKEAPPSVVVAPNAKPAEAKQVAPTVALLKPPIVASKPVPSPPEQIAMNVRPPLPNTPEIIGIPAPPDTVGVIHTRPPELAPPVAPPAPPREVGLPIMAPPQTSILSAPVRLSQQPHTTDSPSATALRTSSPRPGPDDGMGDDNDDEETISLLNPGHGGGVGGGGGDGTGSGRRRGNGIDRGPSGGDQETPSVLESPSFQLPAEYEYHPPKRRVTLAVTVLPNGRVGGISIKQSCGIAEVDEAYKSLVATQYKFRPAYRDGKTFTAVIDCSQSFSTDDE